MEPDTITADLPICTGYLDKTLEIFSLHKHPFIVVSTLAAQWSGVGCLPQDEIDVLARSTEVDAIVKDLIASKDWELSENYVTHQLIPDVTMINSTTVKDIWLKTRIQDPFFRYLRIWPDTLYNLSVDCAKIEVPDLQAKDSLLVEEEYYRDPYQRFGPPRASLYPDRLLLLLQIRAKFLQPDIPIFIPTIEAHINALLTQLRLQGETRLANGNCPGRFISLFVRYLYLDWPPARDWILETKIHACNRELLRAKIDKYQRGRGVIRWDTSLGEWVYGKLPWELGRKKEEPPC
ncbi:MAG: hypothetical protein Q9174_000732 [Haloplaca sp. 1 TL-2023]